MLDIKEVEKIAKLSKLKFNDNEIIEVQKELNSIFKYIENINELDCSNVEPLYHPLDIIGQLREDNVDNTLYKKDFLDNSHVEDDEFIIVPKIV